MAHMLVRRVCVCVCSWHVISLLAFIKVYVLNRVLLSQLHCLYNVLAQLFAFAVNIFYSIEEYCLFKILFPLLKIKY